MQANALAAIVAQFREKMTTKEDLAVRSEFKAELAGVRADLANLKADLTWRFVTLMAFFGTVMTIVDLAID